MLPKRPRRGLSGARQTGADQASGFTLALLGDDAIADRDWLAQVAAAYENPNVLGAGGSNEPLWLQAQPRWLPPQRRF